MKNIKNETIQKITIIICFIIIIILIISIISVVKMKKELTKTSSGNEILKNESENLNNHNYDCQFTKTYHIVNKLDNYIAEVPELSYIVVDMFQSHNASTHIIPTRLKDTLELDKYYEFTYTMQGTGNIKDMSDIYTEISSTELYNASSDETKNTIYKDKSLFVNLTIKETDKQGMEQIQEDICQ